MKKKKISRKPFFDEAIELKRRCLDEIITIVKECGKINFNPEDYQSEDEDKEVDESIWLTIYYMDNESHECVLTSIDVKFDNFLQQDVIYIKAYDVILEEEISTNLSFIGLMSIIDVYGAVYDKVYNK